MLPQLSDLLVNFYGNLFELIRQLLSTFIFAVSSGRFDLCLLNKWVFSWGLGLSFGFVGGL